MWLRFTLLTHITLCHSCSSHHFTKILSFCLKCKWHTHQSVVADLFFTNLCKHKETVSYHNGLMTEYSFFLLLLLPISIWCGFPSMFLQMNELLNFCHVRFLNIIWSHRLIMRKNTIVIYSKVRYVTAIKWKYWEKLLLEIKWYVYKSLIIHYRESERHLPSFSFLCSVSPGNEILSIRSANNLKE